jgi:hypothetical protein
MHPRPRASRAFATRYEEPDFAVWEPLEAVARLSCVSPELPPFHADEFMYMYRVVAARKRGLRIHLYKHIDTRRYLNLDDGGHAYEYCGSNRGENPVFGGRYRLLPSLLDAVERLDFWFFDAYPGSRTSPPECWPPDVAR